MIPVLFKKKGPSKKAAVPSAEGQDSSIDLQRPADPAEVERLYAKALEDMALPEAKRESLIRSENLDRKWQLISQHSMAKQTSSSQGPEKKDNQAPYWAQKLKGAWRVRDGERKEAVTLEEARKLHVLMRTSHKQWLEAFIASGGTKELLHFMAEVPQQGEHLMQRQQKEGLDEAELDTSPLLYELLGCLKALMNNHVGMDSVLEDPEHVEAIALLLDLFPVRQEIEAEPLMSKERDNLETQRLETNKLIMEILSVICWYSDEGHMNVLSAMDKLRRAKREKAPFYSLVSAFKSATKTEEQVALMTFINTLVSSCSRLEDRISVRNDFLALDLLIIGHAVADTSAIAGEAIQKANEAAAGGPRQQDKEASFLTLLQTQIEVFEKMMRADHEEVMMNGVDMSNLDVLLSQLSTAARSAGFAAHLLAVVQALVMIPPERSLGALMWKKVEEAVLAVTALEHRRELRDFEVTYDFLRHLLQQKEQLVEALAAGGLRSQQLGGEAGARSGQSAAPRAGTQAGVSTRNNQEKEAREMHEQPPGSAPFPAAPTTVTPSPETPEATAGSDLFADPKYSKWFKLLKMGMPKEQIVLKMRVEGVDPAILDWRSLSTSLPALSPSSSLGPLSFASLPVPPPVSGTSSHVDPKLEKWFKLKKMGMPIDQIKMKMKAEGVDPGLLDSSSGSSIVSSADSSFQRQPCSAASATPEESKVTLSCDGTVAPYAKLVRMGMPLQQVKLKMKMSGVDPAKLETALLSSLQTGGASNNSSGGGESRVAADNLKTGHGGRPSKVSESLEGTANASHLQQNPALSRVALPPKKPVKPATKLKGLYWNKIQEEAVGGTLWLKLDDSKVQLDVSALERDFAAVAPGIGGEGREVPKISAEGMKGREDKGKPIQLIEGKRWQNCSIALARLRRSPEEVKTAILAMDDSVINLESLKLLKSLVPTEEEIETVNAFEGDLRQLGNVEQLFRALGSVPRLSARLEAITYRQTFEQSIAEAQQRSQMLKEGCLDIEKSPKLLKLLEIVLAIGNYLNAQSVRGGAYGFKLEVLTKLSQVKAMDNKQTLLHYMVRFLEGKHPELLEFYAELTHIRAASELSLQSLQQEVKHLTQGLQQVKKELSTQGSGLTDAAFLNTMQEFIRMAEPQVSQLHNELTAQSLRFQKLVLAFGEDPNLRGDTDPCQKFFGTWDKFISDFKAARAAIVREREQEERERRSAAVAGTSSKKLHTAPPLTVENNKENLFEMYSKSQQGDASEIIKKFRSRHQLLATPHGSAGASPRGQSVRKRSAELASDLATRLASQTRFTSG